RAGGRRSAPRSARRRAGSPSARPPGRAAGWWRLRTSWLLLVPECVDRPQLGGAVGREAAEEQPDEGGYREREQDRRGHHDGFDPGDGEPAADQPDRDAEQPAEQAEHGRFGEELAEDGRARGADGLADADFAD